MATKAEPFIRPSVFMSSATPIWLLLLAATGLSFWLGIDHGAEVPRAGDRIMRVLIIIAFVKIRFVVMHFMGVRRAPWPLRLLLESWIVGVCASLLMLYSLGLPA